jgi:hypothetical protein
MAAHEYVWFIWSIAFLMPWLGLYVGYGAERRVMLLTSVFTAPFGLTEPIFVPSYWNPPSLFDLAHRTGFDLESVIFSFAIGGVGAVLYSALTGARHRPFGTRERRLPLHRHHYIALLAPFVSFPVLYALPWNPIYAAIAAMVVGGIANVWCRPDLKAKVWIGAALFLAYYAVFFIGLVQLWPGYVEHVWNLAALSGIVIAGIPVEELLFAASFGLYWAGAYEHFTWTGIERQSSRGMARPVPHATKRSGA